MSTATTSNDLYEEGYGNSLSDPLLPLHASGDENGSNSSDVRADDITLMVHHQDVSHGGSDTTSESVMCHPNTSNVNDEDRVVGRRQPASCRNIVCGILFWLQLLTIVCFALAFLRHKIYKLRWSRAHSSGSHKDSDDDDDDDDDFIPSVERHHVDFPGDWIGLMFFFASISAITLVLSIVVFVIYSELTEKSAKASLIVSPTIVLLIGLYRSSTPLMFAAMLCVYWTRNNWPRIPFATASLQMATYAINKYPAILAVAVSSLLFSLAWVLAWFMAVAEVSRRYGLFREDGSPVFWKLLLLCLSMLWTWQTIAYVLHTTVAGVVGGWVTDPHSDNHLRSVVGSFRRSTTTSFGSVCVGSLFIATVHTVDYAIREIRSVFPHRSNLCCCILQFCFIHLDWLARRINKWAFVYVGLYGYGFKNASAIGFHVLEARGCWSAVAGNQVADKIIATIKVSNATIAGICGISVYRSFPAWLHAFSSPDYKHEEVVLELFAFWLAFLGAFLLTSVLSRVLLSAVDTVMVKLAESPDDVRLQHTELYQRLRHGWDLSFPNAVGVLDSTDA